jgi:hypothetical protein
MTDPQPLTLSQRIALNLLVKRAKAAETSHRTKRRRERRQKAETCDRAWREQAKAAALRCDATEAGGRT